MPTVGDDLFPVTWADRREAIRLRDARWLRLDPTRNELEAALNKAAAEIIALNKSLDDADPDFQAIRKSSR